MKLNLIGPFVVNAPFATEIAFTKGLKHAGHEVVEIDPNLTTFVPEGADATVVFKTCVGNEEAMIGGLKHPIIVYQPDDARYPHIREMMLKMRKYSDLFLSFDSYGARMAKTMGYKAAETLLLTADPELYSPSPEPVVRDIDVSFIGSIGDPNAHSLRWKMLKLAEILGKEMGWKMHFESTQNMDRILAVYRRSKVVLNHATNVGQPFGTGFGLQCRHFEVGMTKTCLLSNTITNRDELVPKPPDFCEYNEDNFLDELAALVMGQIDGRPAYEVAGEYLYDSIKREHMPVHRANQLVEFIQRNS